MRIGIIKLGARGDVVRTLAILPAIKDKYPESKITWITKENIKDILENHPLINNIFSVSDKVEEDFDILYCLDIEKEASDLARSLKAVEKKGFYLDEGFPMAFNLGAEYYLNTMFDDELKKTNKKTYQQMMFEAIELLPSANEPPKIFLNEDDLNYSEEFAKQNSLSGKVIGIHMGSGPRWPSKAWGEKELNNFIKIARSNDFNIILFAGPDEIGRHRKIISDLKEEGINVIHNDPNNTNRQFASLVNLCDVLVCSDSFALHLATALGKKSVALFFCTSPDEVEPYELISKVISPRIYEFFPEKSDQYSEDLVNSIKAEEVFERIKILNQ